MGWLLIVGLAYFAFSNRDTPSAPNEVRSTATDAEVLTRDEAIENHWDEIREHLDGTDEIEACSLESGSCYSLEADITSGMIETLRFTNRGWLHFGAEIDETGSASDVDDEGRMWDFTLDMGSPLVDDAVAEWARANNRRISD